jgi:hypothetical protein
VSEEKRPEYNVVMIFDRVKPKNAEEMRFDLVIQALAPESDSDNRSIAEATGTGLQGATPNGGGHRSFERNARQHYCFDVKSTAFTTWRVCGSGIELPRANTTRSW